ncbi:electron transport complex, RnfABCDGE type, E subunit [Denitrovibrio acetiphilus DSM 12809]|uniref:Ion-translocating oxidoreductase complex subunit E n=1 Tax=Denitrovibrio acetiphilus (strain DSM 12809 / NBRC 114555 / N2460) TaxID=522772 RepID=D4H113_DENA2|nr:electron transport complex subunit E [Denitrovibrio acetiphilus]ADD68676.1 electron transport complex, RnfABCDGE type, E subunit [Denitrovibrio acetiphilus DSM 12809]
MSLKTFTNGIFGNNPVMKQVLGLCPALAVTTSAINGIAMGLATTAVLIGSNSVVSLVKNMIPAKVRIPAYIVIIASFVTVVDLVMNAYVHELHKVLGLFIPLIVVNCVVLGRAESFASKNGLLRSIMDAVGTGLGFTLALMVLGGVREVLGNGSIMGFDLFGAGFKPSIVMILPPGAFIALGFLMMMYNYVEERKRVKRGGE